MGKTNIGITSATLQEYRDFKKSKGESLPSDFTQNVKEVTPALARQIYDEMYYKRYNIDKIPDTHLAGHLLDITINPGPARAGKWLQESLNNKLETDLKVDGVIGQGTIRALERAKQEGVLDDINNAIARKRSDFYRKKAKNPKRSGFLRGWLDRSESYVLPPVPKRKPEKGG